MEVVATSEITIWPLRSLFPCQVKPPFGYTDNLGESSAAGRPLQDTDGNIWAGNDPGYNPANNPNVVIGNVEYDPVIGCVYPKTLMLVHDQVITTSDPSYFTPEETLPYGYIDPPPTSNVGGTPAPQKIEYNVLRPEMVWGNLNNFTPTTPAWGVISIPQSDVPGGGYPAGDWQPAGYIEDSAASGEPGQIIIPLPTDPVTYLYVLYYYLSDGTNTYFFNPYTRLYTLGTVLSVNTYLVTSQSFFTPGFWAASLASWQDVIAPKPEAPYGGTPWPAQFRMDGTPPVVAQAFFGIMKIGFASTLNYSGGAMGEPSYPGGAPAQSSASMRWRVSGSGRTPRWFQATFTAGGDVEFTYNDSAVNGGPPDEGAWVYVDKIKMGSRRSDIVSPQSPSNVPLQGNSGNNQFATQSVEVRLLGGQMQVRLSGDDTPYVWPHFQTDEDGNPDWFIDLYQVEGYNVISMAWAVHLIKFAAPAGLLSNPINAGYPVDDYQEQNAEFIIHTAPSYLGESDLTDDNVRTKGFLPPGCLVTAEVAGVSGTNLFYNLIFQNSQ